MNQKLDFTSPAHAQNPHLLYEEMRELGDVVKIKLPIIGKVWMTTSHEATAAMLKDNGRFSMREPSKDGLVAGMQWWMPNTIRLLANNMLSSDEPDHRRLRKLVDKAFQRRSIAKLEPAIKTIAKDLLDKQRHGVPFDLVDTYARELPLQVICQLLGLDARESDAFAFQAAKMSSINGIWDFLKAMPPLHKMRKQMERIVSEEQARQLKGTFRTGLIAELVRAEENGDRLTRDELIAMIFLLLIAGQETTTHMISGSVLTLLQHPAQMQSLVDSPQSIDLAVEELLRHVSAVEFSKPRLIQRAGEFYGADLKQGDKIMASLGAANRDPRHFDRPKDLLLDRKPNPHLEFGTGIHFCLGFQLARLEIRIALQMLLERFPTLCLSQPRPEWNSRMGLRSIKHLHIVGK